MHNDFNKYVKELSDTYKKYTDIYQKSISEKEYKDNSVKLESELVKSYSNDVLNSFVRAVYSAFYREDFFVDINGDNKKILDESIKYLEDKNKILFEYLYILGKKYLSGNIFSAYCNGIEVYFLRYLLDIIAFLRGIPSILWSAGSDVFCHFSYNILCIPSPECLLKYIEDNK